VLPSGHPRPAVVQVLS
jgi:hypothetical protein